jgi:glycerophosphoryl diester phosphodiesterase
MKLQAFALGLMGALALAAGPLSADDHRPGRREPLVIAHRGASGYLPEHTLAGYELAIDQGADFIEPDLVMTKDGHLVVRHDLNVGATTDVAAHPEFAGRKKTMAVDGVPEEGWFVPDFTLAELRTLRIVQRYPDRSHAFDGRYRIPTFDEVLELARRRSHEERRPIGVYPETKHPTLHRSLGLPLEPAIVRALRHVGWDHRDAPVFLQSFEPSSLQMLRRMTDNRLVQLVDASDVAPDGSIVFEPPFDRPYDWTVSTDPKLRARRFDFLVSDEGLREVRTYADVISPWKRYVVSSAAVDRNGDGAVGDENGDGVVNEADRVLLPPTDLVERAHALGLAVHLWTFRSESRFLVSDYAGNPVNEYLQFLRLGVDGLFSEFPDTAVTARALLRLEEGGQER